MNSAAGYNNSGSGFLKFIFILIVMLLIGYAFFATGIISTQYSHSDWKHVNTSELAETCFSSGPDLTIQDGTNNNKYIEYCYMDTEEGGILAVRVIKRINGKLEEITKYVRKERFANLRDATEVIDFNNYDVVNYASPRMLEVFNVFP